MCGRYSVFTEEENIEIRQIINEINERYLNSELHAAMATGEIFPTNVAPVLVADGTHLMRWGFPKWNGPGVVINARAETAEQKQMFRQALANRRCIIPSTGFYEWSHSGPKIKYLCRLPEEPLLLMAGIHSTYANERGEREDRYVILTTDPSESISHIHNRMPVILQPEERDAWISDRVAAMDILHRAGPELDLKAV